MRQPYHVITLAPTGRPILPGKIAALADDRASLGVNVTNLIDKTYYRNVQFSFGGAGGFYGEPRRVIGNVRVNF